LQVHHCKKASLQSESNKVKIMSRGVNKVILIGSLGNDPEVKYTQDSTAITNISVATSESWKDKNTGQVQQRVEWHRVVFFKKLAEIAGEYLRKGSKVYIEGSLRTRKWQAQDGSDRYSTEVVADVMQMLDGKDDRTQSQSSDVIPASEYGLKPDKQITHSAAPALTNNFDDFDDLPFN